MSFELKCPLYKWIRDRKKSLVSVMKELSVKTGKRHTDGDIAGGPRKYMFVVGEKKSMDSEF